MADLPARTLSGELSDPEENEDLLEAALARRGGDDSHCSTAFTLPGEEDPISELSGTPDVDDPFNPATLLLEEDEEETTDSEYRKMRQKICHDAMINISGFDLFDESGPGIKVKTMFDCGPGASPRTFLDVIHRYLQQHTACNLMVGRPSTKTEALLEASNFPLHAVILSGLGHTTVKDMKIKLQDIKGVPAGCCDEDRLRELVSFIRMSSPALSKLRAAKHLGITEPAVSFLKPLSKPDVPPLDQVFSIGNLDHEDLMIFLQEKSLESIMGTLAWPQVHHSLTSTRERIGFTD